MYSGTNSSYAALDDKGMHKQGRDNSKHNFNLKR